MRVLTRLFAAVAAALLAALLIVPSASADEPINVGTNQITDVAGVGADTSKARDALQELQADEHVGLFVVIVNSFEDVQGQTWAKETFTQSDLGDNDVLLAIAVQDGRWSGYVNANFPLSAATVSRVISQHSLTDMRSGDWPQVVISASQGLAQAVGNGGSNTGGAATGGNRSDRGGGSGFIWILLIAAIVVVAVLAYRAAKRNKAAQANAQADQGPPPEPYEHLSDRAVQILIQTDNAVRASDSELQLAEEDFGAETTAEFRAAHDRAKTKLTKAFQLRQQIEDSEENKHKGSKQEQQQSEQERRGWMQDILDLCDDASAVLEEQTDKFEKLQNLKARLPEVLAALPGRIDTQKGRLPQAAATVERLGDGYSDKALVTIDGNTDQASERLEFAAGAVEKANETADDADNSAAVLAARTAQEAVKQATSLLDAIDRLETNLTEAGAKLATAREHVSSELSDARDALGEASAGAEADDIRQRLDSVQQTLDECEKASAKRNPVATMKKLTTADHKLDDILSATRDAQKQEKRARASLDQELTTAQSTVSAVDDFISNRRGAMETGARTKLAEAKRHLQHAHDIADSDAAGAVSEAGQATDLARQAYAEARNDVDRWYGGPGRGSMMGGMGGAMLGGILMGSMMGGGFYGGMRGGGWGGGLGGFGGGMGGGFGGGFGGGGFGGSF